MEDLFQVGVITAPHGVRGEVKVFPTTDDNARFKNLENSPPWIRVGEPENLKSKVLSSLKIW